MKIRRKLQTEEFCFRYFIVYQGFKVYSASSALFMPLAINKYNMNMAYKQTIYTTYTNIVTIN